MTKAKESEKQRRARSNGEREMRSFSYHFLFLTALFCFLTTFFSLPLSFAAFEQIGAGARPIGMASAFTAISDDAHAIYYNPAGLAQIRRGELTAGYGKLYAGLKDNSNLGSGFVGVVQSLKQGKWGSAGIGWLNLNLEGAYREDLISFAYGKETILDGLFVGGNTKVLKRTFASDLYTQMDPLFTKSGYNSTNFAVDLGFLYRPSANYSWGLMIKDFNQPNVGLGEEERVPLEIRGGFGYHQRQLVFDGEISRKGKDINISIGVEKYLFKVAGLRAGFSGGSRNKREIATGMSYKGDYFGVDYAFVFPLSGIESTAGSHRFGIVVKFGKKAEKSRWEFEEEEIVVERLLEEKSAQISAMEKELENLRDQNRSGRLESTWVRTQIQKLEEKLRVQETKELEEMKSRLFESKIETEKMKRKVKELEDRIQRLAVPKPKPEVISPPAVPESPAIPRTYVVQEGETLESIARKFYGDASLWTEIYDLNSDRMERGGTVRPGQVLLMPQR